MSFRFQLAAIILLALSFTNVRAQQSSTPRIKYTINGHWQFIRHDLPINKVFSSTDSTWSAVNLPHTWNKDDAFDDKPGYYRGPAWYRKALFLGPDLKNKQLVLHFEGANQVVDVYLNGQKVGHHAGGYTAFNVNITNAVKFNADNTLAVRVDNSYNKNIPPLNADFTFFGGIYRDVWLIAANPVHLSLNDHASSGVYITTPSVSEQSAKVSIRGSITNEMDKKMEVRVENTILDADGHIVKKMTSRMKLSSSQNKSFKQESPSIANPELWTPDHPYLYTVRTTIYRDGQAVDQVTNPLGFRWYHFDPDKGFFLNGKHLKLIGTNRHQDFPNIGNAVSNELHIQDMKRIKDMGANFVRLAHYPQDPSVLKAADRLGIIIWEEIPIVDYITPSDAFRKNAETMLTEMISQHYNHPAVMLWGYMNEILLQDKEDQYPGDTYHKDILQLAKDLNQLAHQLDPNRVTTMAMHISDLYNKTGIADVPDVVGWNPYFGWYYGAYSDLGTFLDKQHRQHPKRPTIISEYGTGSDSRIHTKDPQKFDFSVEYQQEYHESYLRQIKKRPFIAGSALWIINDFASEGRGDSRPHINQKGIVRYNRTPKDVYYFYKSQLSDKPVLHIASTQWKTRYLLDDSASTSVKIYSNLSNVKLLLNGQSLGTKTISSDDTATWQLPVQSGVQHLTAQGQTMQGQIEDHLALHFHLVPDLFNEDSSFTELSVNVGGHVHYIPKYGSGWVPDHQYRPGGWGAVGGEEKLTHRNILGSHKEPLYQFYREGIKMYRLDVPDGDYQLKLYFAEPEYKKSGKRVFSVAVNGRTIFDHLDLAGQFGAGWPLSKKVIVHATDGKGIKINFKALKGEPILNGIKLKDE